MPCGVTTLNAREEAPHGHCVPGFGGEPILAWPKKKAAKEEKRRRCVREKSFALPNAPPYLKLDTMRKLPNPS